MPAIRRLLATVTLTGIAMLGLTGCGGATQGPTYATAANSIRQEFNRLTNDVPATDRLSVLKYAAQKSQCDTNRFSQTEQHAIYVKPSFDLNAYLAKEKARLAKAGFKVEDRAGVSVPGSTTLSMTKADYHYQIATLTRVKKADVKTSKGILLAVTGPCVPAS